MGYGKWRDYDPEDTVRFYALRMNEVGMITVDTAEDYRARNGFEISERAKEGAKDVSPILDCRSRILD